MYDFVTGPLAWISFGIFFVGLIYRLVWYVRGLNWQMDRVTYSKNVTYGIKGAFRSLFYWLVPFGTRSWRFYFGFTILVFIFHACLLATPIFLKGHNVILLQRWGFSLPTLPGSVTDMMSVAVIVAAILIILRRIALPEVRIITKPYDFLILAIAVAPFLTGFLAYHQVGDYNFWIVVHVLCGEVMLVAIPFTKLSHFMFFFLSRIQLGMDFGIKRGGMKNKGIAW